MDARTSSTLFVFKKMDTKSFNSVPAHFGSPIIIQDTSKTDDGLRKWRVMPMTGNEPTKIWASASAAPRKRDLKKIKKKVDKITENRVKKIIIVDLRQESHGYLNGQSINLTGPNNWVNIYKTHEEAVESESSWLKSLSTRNDAHLQKYQHEQRVKNTGEIIHIKHVKSESEIVKDKDLEYFRITVPDHSAPSNKEVDRFIKFVDALEDGTWLHFHCRGGMGRSTSFLAMYYMLHFANLYPLDDIVKLQASVPPNYNLSVGSLDNTHLKQTYAARYRFLGKFYEYAQARLNGCKHGWSEWLEDERANSLSANHHRI